MRFYRVLAPITLCAAPFALAACGDAEAPMPPPGDDSAAVMPEAPTEQIEDNPDEMVIDVEPEMFSADPMDAAEPMADTAPMTDDFGGEETSPEVPEGAT